MHESVTNLPVIWANTIKGVQKVEARACILTRVTGAGLPLYCLFIGVKERDRELSDQNRTWLSKIQQGFEPINNFVCTHFETIDCRNKDYLPAQLSAPYFQEW